MTVMKTIGNMDEFMLVIRVALDVLSQYHPRSCPNDDQ